MNVFLWTEGQTVWFWFHLKLLRYRSDKSCPNRAEIATVDKLSVEKIALKSALKITAFTRGKVEKDGERINRLRVDPSL